MHASVKLSDPRISLTYKPSSLHFKEAIVEQVIEEERERKVRKINRLMDAMDVRECYHCYADLRVCKRPW